MNRDAIEWLKKQVPSPHDWQTTDEDEVNRRRLRAQTESFSVKNSDDRFPVFSNFRVRSASGLEYQVEIRDIATRQFACDCVDFRINGLGTCKHVETVLLHLEARHKRRYRTAVEQGSDRLDAVVDPEGKGLQLQRWTGQLPSSLRRHFDKNGRWQGDSPEDAVEDLRRLAGTKLPALRISQDVAPWLEERRQAIERKALRKEYELKVQRKEWPDQETLVPLFPYQREGMLHLAFTERALLADEMGLGKTIQAIAACALLHRLGQVQRVLVVCPASLKTEWEEQIQRFTSLPYQLIYGQRIRRLQAYQNAPFFTLVNYEQMLSDTLEVNARLRPDAVILDEAQRIKNWSTKTSRAVKRLRSRYAFVLTGTPIENRIDELHSLMDFLNPRILGPLFRFNREYYVLDERGRPQDYRNLDRLQERIAPCLLRRRKADVETELPERTTRTFFVKMSPRQQVDYDYHEQIVARLANLAKRRALNQLEQEKLMRHLAMMRMLCDTPYILDPNDRVCPKLGEIEKLLEECRENSLKVLVFSEWERMLELVRDLCDRMDIGYAWHTGTVPQKRRRAEINLFKSDPECRVFLSTDSGGVGLNLQSASVVIHCDLPWNPARLEQRIARAWRKFQTRSVTVIQLVSERTIEQRMLDTLAHKRALADGVLDHVGDLSQIKLRSGRQAFLERLNQLVTPIGEAPPPKPAKPPLPADRALGFARRAAEQIDGALRRCEERYPRDAAHSVLLVVVERDAASWRTRLEELHQEFFGPGQGDPLAPVRLEVIDRATDEAIERLAAAGLVQTTSRASRPLIAAAEEPPPPPLTLEEQERALAARVRAARQHQAARLLGDGGLEAEAAAAAAEAALALGRAIAIEHRMPEPAGLPEIALPPLAHLWKTALPAIQGLTANAAAAWRPTLDALPPFLSDTQNQAPSNRQLDPRPAAESPR